MRRTTISVLLGILVVGTGFMLAHAGGWGPCGPASHMSEVGGWLTGIMLVYYVPISALLAMGLAVLLWSGLFYAILGVFWIGAKGAERE